MSARRTRTLLRVALKEGVAYARQGAAMVTGEVHAEPLADGAHARVFVHGIQADPRVLRPLMRALRDDTPQLALPLGRGSVPEMARGLARALGTHTPRDATLDLIGHSLGGLVLRWLVAHERVGARVRRLVTLGSPHQGSRITRVLPGGLMRDLRPGSPLLRQLRASRLPPDVRAVYIAARHDQLVRPHHHALLPCGEPVVLDAMGHGGLLHERRAHEAVRRALA